MNDLTKVSGPDSGMSPESRLSHNRLSDLCSKLCIWMDSLKDELTDHRDFNSSCKIFGGKDILAAFRVQGIVNPDNYNELLEHLKMVNEEWQVRLQR